MNTEIAYLRIRDLIVDGSADQDNIREVLNQLAEAQFEAGKKQAFEELRHLIGAATTPGRE